MTELVVCFRSRHHSTVQSRHGKKDPFSFGSSRDSSEYLKDAKKLYAEGEQLFRNGQFRQGQELFKDAERQLREAKFQMPFQPFDNSKTDWNSPMDPASSRKTWKASSLAVLSVGALAALVAGKHFCDKCCAPGANGVRILLDHHCIAHSLGVTVHGPQCSVLKSRQHCSCGRSL